MAVPSAVACPAVAVLVAESDKNRPCGDCIVYRSGFGSNCTKCVIDLTEEECTPPGH